MEKHSVHSDMWGFFCHPFFRLLLLKGKKGGLGMRAFAAFGGPWSYLDGPVLGPLFFYYVIVDRLSCS